MYRMVFTQIFRGVACLLLAGALGACAPWRNVAVEVLRPAPVVVKPEARVGVWDRNVSYRTTPLRFKDEEGARAELLEQFARGMEEVMQAVGRTDSVVYLLDSRADTLEQPALPEPLARDSVDALCRTLGADYVASVEMCWWELRGEEISYHWLVRLYAAGEEAPLDSARFVQEVGSMRELEYYGDLYDFLQLAAKERGMEYAGRMVPHWETCRRRIYNRGRILRLGDAYYRDGKEEEALGVWNAALRLSAKTAVRAALNIAWMYEKAGEYEAAAALLTKWQGGRQAMKSGDADYVAAYLELLAERMKERVLLDEQLPAAGE